MADKSEKILIIDENTGYVRYLKKILKKPAGDPFEIETAASLSAGLEYLSNGDIDAVIMDFSLPDSEGMDSFLKVHAHLHDIPVIVMTSIENERLGKAAVERGAQGHLLKHDMDPKGIERMLRYAIVRSRYKRDKIKAVVQQELEVADLGPHRSLFILYQVGRVINTTDSLVDLFDKIINLIFEAIDATRCAIFITDKNGKLDCKISRRRKGAKKPPMRFMKKIIDRAVEEDNAVICVDTCYDQGLVEDGLIEEKDIHSVMAIPLWEHSQMLGAIYLDNPVKDNAFNGSDLDLVTSIAGQIAMKVHHDQIHEQMRENAIVRANLERFHSPDVAQLILEQSNQEGGFQKFLREREVTILFADISDFTPLLERLDPEEAADLMNNYLEEMSTIIFRYKGNIDKFIGDAIMATFGAPISYGNDAELAIFAAIEMMKEMEKFKAGVSEKKKFDIRIGVNTGMVITGYIGSKSRIEYTVLGDPVNIAARLQHIAPSKSIYVGEDTYARVGSMFEFKDLGSKYLKGKKKKIKIYEAVY